MNRPTRVIRYRFSAAAGLLCFAWAFLGWLTVIPNQDILADGIQAQSLLTDPRIVLAFPGQKHGGPLEYPFTVLAEWLAPGNYFANAAIRPVLAFITGFLVAELFLTLFPKTPKWAFLTAVAVGPTIIHGMLGPQGNPVGVWWLQPNWDMAWLFVTAGALVITRSAKAATKDERTTQSRWLVPALGGLLVGLGFFAHPAISLLIVPLLTLVLLLTRPRLTTLAIAAAGAAIGVLPAAVSYVVNSKVNTWDPSHGAFIAVSYYREMGGAVLGLTGIPDYMMALLPYGIGLAPSQLLLSGTAQSVIMWAFVVVIAISAAVAIISAIRNHRALSPGGATAAAWLVAMVTMFAFITFVDPVWIYSSGLAILFWLSIGALPSFFTRPRLRPLGTATTAVLLAVVALSTISHNAAFYSDIPARITAKATKMDEQQAIARALEDAGATVVFGSYYDAIPVGYASGGRLRTITNHYNRFPLTEAERQAETITVGVNTAPTDPWGDEAMTTMAEQCAPSGATPSPSAGSFAIFECPPAALVFNR